MIITSLYNMQHFMPESVMALNPINKLIASFAAIVQR